MLYDGPIIDAHTHLWNLDTGRYPWLEPSGDFGPPGRYDRLKGRNYELPDYRADIAGTSIVASVHIEALWDAADDPVSETWWLESIEDRGRFADRYVAGAHLGDPHSAEVIRAQASFSRVKGVRQTIAWTPDPNRRMAARPHLTRDPDWRAALPTLIDSGLHLELLMYPWQAEDVLDLATDFPELPIVIDHIGSPIDPSPAGMQRWHDGISLMARGESVTMKLSAAASYVSDPSAEVLRPLIAHLVSEFGADRLMYGSDFPVGSLVGLSLPDYLDVYRQCLTTLTPTEQSAVFVGNAARIYGFGDLRPET